MQASCQISLSLEKMTILPQAANKAPVLFAAGTTLLVFRAHSSVPECKPKACPQETHRTFPEEATGSVQTSAQTRNEMEQRSGDDRATAARPVAQQTIRAAISVARLAPLGAALGLGLHAEEACSFWSNPTRACGFPAGCRLRICLFQAR